MRRMSRIYNSGEYCKKLKGVGNSLVSFIVNLWSITNEQ